MQHRFNNVMANSSPISSAQNQQQMQIGGGTNNGNEIVQHQILNEIQRFESVHPCIYRIYDLVEKIENDQIANLIRQQVISIEDAFVNSQEWTLSRMINEIRLGVIGSEDSCKNSLIHYFLTRNWNWEDAPEGGRFKKEVMVDGRSFLLLIRDEGSREPTLQFSQWLDALLIVFTLDSRKSFQYALELQQLVNNFRSLDGAEMPIYLVGMKNMSNMGHQRMVSEEEAQRIAKTRKMCNYFECLDGSNVQRMFNNVCQRVVQQRSSSRVSSFIGRTNMGLSHEFVAPGDPMLASMSSASFLPAGRPSSYHQHQRSISVLPINSDLQQQQPIGHHIHAPGIPSRGRTPRYEEVPMPPTHFHPPPAHLRTQQSFTPGSVGYYSSNNEAAVGRKRESIDWQSRPIAISSFAIPNAPSCSAVLGGQCGNGNNNNNPLGEQLAAISPAYSHSSLSSSHYQISGANNTMTATPYARSASNMPGGAGGHHSHPHRPCSDPSSQSPLFFDSRQPHHQQQQQLLAHPLSNATSSSTLVVNNSNGNGSTANLLPTPGSTPKTERKGKRISNIFRKEHIATPDERIAKSSAEINMGIGRAIPVKQGQLYKRTKNGLNKEWKKKYVCLYSDGRICYHQNLKDYMEKDSRAKEIYLGLATVRTSDRHRNRGGGNNRNSMLPTQKEAKSEWPCEPRNEAEDIRSPTGELSEGVSDGCSVENNATGGFVTSTTSSSILVGSGDKEKAGKKEKAKEKKKRAKRVGSGVKNDEEEEKCEFEIVSCDQKHWEFSAPTVEERDQWVMCIEREIEKCLQQQLSLKDQQQLNNGSRNGQHFSRNNAGGNADKRREHIQALRRIDGNDRCADCSAQQPQWASINLGTLICIECSGIHRKLGSHISKVRSLELDDWPPEHLVVMQAIGNTLANQVWEHNALPKDKPGPDSTREQKEHWIRLKYEEKLYLPPIPVDRTLSQQLVDAVLSRSIRQLLMVLPRCTKLEVNAPIGGQNEDRRTALHLACGIGAPEILQLLIWYNADIRALDEQGRSALWHAQVNGSSECAAILIQAGLRPDEECPGGGAVDSGFSEAYRGSSSNNAADNR